MRVPVVCCVHGADLCAGRVLAPVWWEPFLISRDEIDTVSPSLQKVSRAYLEERHFQKTENNISFLRNTSGFHICYSAFIIEFDLS